MTPAPISNERLAAALESLGLSEIFSIAAVRIAPSHIEVDRFVYTDGGSVRLNLLTERPMTTTTRIEVR